RRGFNLGSGLGFQEARSRPPGFVAPEGMLLFRRQITCIVVGHTDHYGRLEGALVLDVPARLTKWLARPSTQCHVANAEALDRRFELGWCGRHQYGLSSVNLRHGFERALRAALQQFLGHINLGWSWLTNREVQTCFLNCQRHPVVVLDPFP